MEVLGQAKNFILHYCMLTVAVLGEKEKNEIEFNGTTKKELRLNNIRAYS